MTDNPIFHDQAQPVSIIITLNDVTHQTMVNTYGDMQVLFAAIQKATGIDRYAPIPKDLFISVKRLPAASYYGGVQ